MKNSDLHYQSMRSRSISQQEIVYERVINVWDSEKNCCVSCICPKAPANLTETKNIQHCYRCGKQYHSDCFWSKEKDQIYQCPFCCLINCRPQKPVRNIIFAGYLPFIKKEKIMYKIDLQVNEELRKSRKKQLQIRCAKFNSKNRFQISWPDSGFLTVNKQRVSTFTPLPSNSPLKKRQDNPVKLPHIKNGNYEIIIQQKNCSELTYKTNKRCHHLVMIFAVEDVNELSILETLSKKRLSFQQGKLTMNSQLRRDIDGIAIQKLVIQLKCQFYGSPMGIPARSVLCTHIQVFDIKSMIISSVSAKGNIRAWKCPICNIRSYDIIIDQYLLSMIDITKSIKQISFSRDIQPIITYLTNQQVDQSSQTKTKNKSIIKTRTNSNKSHTLKQQDIIQIDESQQEQQKQIEVIQVNNDENIVVEQIMMIPQLENNQNQLYFQQSSNMKSNRNDNNKLQQKQQKCQKKLLLSDNIDIQLLSSSSSSKSQQYQQNQQNEEESQQSSSFRISSYEEDLDSQSQLIIQNQSNFQPFVHKSKYQKNKKQKQSKQIHQVTQQKQEDSVNEKQNKSNHKPNKGQSIQISDQYQQQQLGVIQISESNTIRDKVWLQKSEPSKVNILKNKRDGIQSQNQPRKQNFRETISPTSVNYQMQIQEKKIDKISIDDENIMIMNRQQKNSSIFMDHPIEIDSATNSEQEAIVELKRKVLEVHEDLKSEHKGKNILVSKIEIETFEILYERLFSS